MMRQLRARIMMLPIVRYAPVIYMAVMTIFALLLMPGVAMAGDHIDPDGYVDSYMNQNHLGTDSSTMLENNQFDTYHGGEVLPGFDQIGSYMSGLMLGFIPVLFVIKFAGRAMLSITHSGDARGNMDIPNFFKSSEERNADPSRGGAKVGSSWYVSMGKDFLRYFGVAVAVWLIFAGIIAVVNLVLNLNGAPSADSEGFMDQFN